MASVGVGGDEQKGASMGPRLHNRGYDQWFYSGRRPGRALQWVHGFITVVMIRVIGRIVALGPASMGPRLHNRGYVRR